MVSGSAKSGGLLLAAFRAGVTEPITWTELPFGELVLTVAEDALKGPLNDRTGVRLPVSYNDQVVICRELGCVVPTQPIADAMFAQAKRQLGLVALVRTAADSAKMATVDFTLRFHDGVEKQLAALPPPPPGESGLAFGAWKLWILHPRIVERGAVNYGFWDRSKKPAKPVQTVGGQHDAAHYDYSQVLHLVKRFARNARSGEPVDLLQHFAEHDKIPAKYLDPYREAPAAGAVSFAEPEDAEVNLAETLTAAGVDVAAAKGWETRGRPGFTPAGIMVHHTAGPKKGDAPTLQLCIDGRKDPKNPKNDLPGPLCHIVLARSGKAHVIAGNIANHAGKGAQQVLDLLRKDEPVSGNAVDHKYEDATFGNAFFYGIEVENAGTPDDPYPEAQIDALAKICAALCHAHGWSAHRVIHHRQWTKRKIDMSYKGDLPALTAQWMDTGASIWGVSFSEEEAPEPTAPSLQGGAVSFDDSGAGDEPEPDAPSLDGGAVSFDDSAASGWEAYARDSGTSEAGQPLPDDLAGEIERARAAVPTVPGLIAHGAGHMYTGSADKPHLAYLKEYFQKRAARATPADRRKILAFSAFQAREGSTAAINTYDNQIVTWGTGWGGLGGLGGVMTRATGNETVRRRLAGAGVRYREKNVWDVVDMGSKLVVTGKAEALELVRHSMHLVYLLIDLARDPATRDAVAEAQLATFMRGSADLPGSEAIATQALFNLTAHLKHWAPGYVMGCLEWAVPQLAEAAPSAERDQRLAILIARYFYGKARLGKPAWVPRWEQFQLYFRHLKQDGLDCTADPFITAATAPTADPFAEHPLPSPKAKAAH